MLQLYTLFNLSNLHIKKKSTYILFIVKRKLKDNFHNDVVDNLLSTQIKVMVFQSILTKKNVFFQINTMNVNVRHIKTHTLRHKRYFCLARTEKKHIPKTTMFGF